MCILHKLTFVINHSISVQIGLFNHFFYVFVVQFLAQLLQNTLQIVLGNHSAVVDVKHYSTCKNDEG